MNCLEYRRLLGSDPRHESADMQAHRQECTRCAEHQARSLGFEMQLRRVLNVPVPMGLAERILLAQTTEHRRERGDQRRRWGAGFAIAASLAVAVGLGTLWSAPTAEAFPNMIVDHLAHEPGAFASSQNLPNADVQQRFDNRGVRLAAELPAGISYVSACPIGPYRSVHMVMPEKSGPVTVIYIADHRESGRDDFERNAWHGRSVPMGQGTLVLVAQDSALFDTLERSWRHSIEGDVNTAAGGR
ncbi:MAG: DUF3379 family protein [Tahibacter sp.]